MPRKLKRVFRAFGLLWARMGSARTYVAVIIGLVIALAAVGAWHIVSVVSKITLSKQDQTARAASQPQHTVKKDKTPTNTQTATPMTRSDERIANSSPEPQPLSPAPAFPAASATPSDLGREIAITDVKQTMRRGRRGETLVIATVGMASRTNVEKSNLEIRISFFDLNSRNEIRPTDAEVTYRWLTPVRDWSDPAPKYLAATYLQRPIRYPWFERRRSERLRYGGFLIRIYLDGKLEDERSQPEGLLARLRGDEPTRPGSAATPDVSPGSSTRVERDKSVTAERSPSLASPTPLPKKGGAQEEPTLPYGKPVPGKPGFVSSPYDARFIIDVRGFPPGTLVNDPNTNRPFRVP